MARNNRDNTLVASDEGITRFLETRMRRKVSFRMKTVEFCAYLIEVCEEGGRGFDRVGITGHCTFAVEILFLKGCVYLFADRLLLCAESIKFCLNTSANYSVY